MVESWQVGADVDKETLTAWLREPGVDVRGNFEACLRKLNQRATYESWLRHQQEQARAWEGFTL